MIDNIILRTKMFLTIRSENYLPIILRKLWQPQKTVKQGKNEN